MLSKKIMDITDFEFKIKDLKEDELGIYQEKEKPKINYPLFAETFLTKFNIIKEAKQGNEKFNYYIYGKNYWILVDLDLVKGLIRNLLENIDYKGAGLLVEERIAKEIFNLAVRIEELDMLYYKMNFNDFTYSFKNTTFEESNENNYFIDVNEYGKKEMNMNTPIFDKFMMDIMCEDIKAVELLLQYMGSCISGMQKLEKFVLLIGNGSNGKSTLIKLLSNIIGDKYVETRDINKLDDRFSIQGLDKKKLLISTESSSKKEINAETLKKLTTPNEKVYMDIKNKEAKTVELNLNLMFACNQPIDFGQMDEQDKSIVRRLIVIPFNRMFEEHEKDKELDEKMKLEIPGITLKLIQAYERLVKNNYILPKSEMIDEATEEYVEKYLYKKSPNMKIKNFIDMYLEKDENCLMSISYMYEKYQEKTSDTNMKEQTFAKEVRLAMPERDKRDPSKKDKIILDKEEKNSSRYFVGFKVKDGLRRRKPIAFAEIKEFA